MQTNSCEICGVCKHKAYNIGEEMYICNNEESENYGMEIDYKDSCIDFESVESE